MAAYLEGISGEYAGKRILLDQAPFYMGRSVNNHLRLEAPNISREHVAIFCTNGSYSLQDRNSRLGTLVNGSRVQTIGLHSGDVVTIGASSFRFMQTAPVSPIPKQEQAVSQKKEKTHNPFFLIVCILVGIIGITFLVKIPTIIENKKMHAEQTADAVASNAMATAASEATATVMYEATEAQDSSQETKKEYVTKTVYTSSEPLRLIEDESNNTIEQEFIGIVGNYILEMTVTNPSDVSSGFDYGILFSDLEAGDQYLLSFTDESISDTSFKEISLKKVASIEGGLWALLRRASVDEEYELERYGSIYNFHRKGSAANSIKFITYNDEGYLYVNNDFVAEINLGDWSNSGSVSVCTDIFQDYGRSGSVIQIDSIKLQEITN